MTIASIEKVFIEDLTAMYGSDEAGSIAWLVIGFVCQINRSQYLNNKNDDLSDEQLASFSRILIELKKGMPVQYILGETEFYGSVFKVDPSVLIPRPETEELVDWVLKDVKALKYESKALKVLDIGTGSGCIAVTLKKYLPEAEVFALDISAKALDVAKENAELNNAAVNFLKDDIMQPGKARTSFDIIISNPPYVTLNEKDAMHSNVIDYEPHIALFVPDDNALVFYSAIADFALHNLVSDGTLYLEINENLGPQTLALLTGKGFGKVKLRKDLRDRDRMIKVQLR